MSVDFMHERVKGVSNHNSFPNITKPYLSTVFKRIKDQVSGLENSVHMSPVVPNLGLKQPRVWKERKKTTTHKSHPGAGQSKGTRRRKM